LTISINDRHRFIAEGKTTTYEGWVYYYKPYVSLQNSSIPELHEGDLLRNNFVEIEESFSKPPNRYTPSSLLSKMEQEGIGTKATRADIIATLLKRGYLSSANRGLIGVTQLGVSIIESMRKYVPRIVSTELTKTMDNQLEMIEQGSLSSKEVIEGSIDHLVEALALFREKKIEVGREIWLAAASASAQAAVIGNCPVCNSGKLGIIRSRSTGKRFIGCSNYSSDGCRASAPLPQRGIVVATRTLCESCRWPKLLVKFARRSRPWIMCANVQCPLKEEKKGYPDKS
jgi:DNA topoisomerase-1